jgi:hypothetical protein
MERAFSIKFGNKMKYDIQIKLFNFVFQKGNFCEVESIINRKLFQNSKNNIVFEFHDLLKRYKLWRSLDTITVRISAALTCL